MNTYYTLGELLFQARQERGLSHYDVEKMTHIRGEYIEALETSDYETLPADVYTRGILKNYSEFLNLPYEEVIMLYRKDGVLSSSNTQEKKATLRFDNNYSPIQLGKWLGGIAGAVVLAFLGFYMFAQYQVLNTPPEILIERPQNEYETSNIQEVTLAGITELESQLFINGQKIVLEEDGSFAVPFTLAEGENIIQFVATSTRNNKSSNYVRTIIYEPPVVEIANTIIVEARRIAVWVEVENSEEIIFSQNIEVGEQKTFQSSGQLILKTRDAAHTYITVNGEERGPMGEESVEGELVLE